MIRPLEDECENTLVEGAMALGFRVHVERRSRTASGRHATAIKGHPGWPDVVIAGYERVLVVELKRHPNKPTDDQLAWLALLSRAGLDARLIYVPEGVGSLLAELTSIRNNHLKGNHPI